jgi:hypothetical protein
MLFLQQSWSYFRLIDRFAVEALLANSLTLASPPFSSLFLLFDTGTAIAILLKEHLSFFFEETV